MTDTQDPLWRALARLELAELSDDERNLLRPAFAAMHSSHAMRIPEDIVKLIRRLDATLPKTTETPHATSIPTTYRGVDALHDEA
ncbi:hypothetical protein [Burkholderia vietnamiensis]|uniref:hypothetical protein n=1 Tax=Burkholderia vietnamiensis TaxID=60552 RepID=UPI001CB49E63|nr:hypothetical protein [Burkholderia vietnamiensis]CAG9197065.1 hypothetical protein BVI2075_230080 [Burkholderia vietnamiensis]